MLLTGLKCKKKANFLAINGNGHSFWFEHKPELIGDYFYSNSGFGAYIGAYKCNPILIERPNEYKN